MHRSIPAALATALALGWAAEARAQHANLYVGDEVVAFEDVATAASDADQNDLVVRINQRCEIDGTDELVEEEIHLVALAAGAEHDNGLGIALRATPTSVTWTPEGGAQEARSVDASDRVVIHPDFRSAFASPATRFVNTDGGDIVAGVAGVLRVAYPDGVPASGSCPPADLAVVRSGVWIDDTTTLADGRPLLARVPADFEVARERVPLGQAYPDFLTWLADDADGCAPEGCVEEDWYLRPQADQVVARPDLDTTAALPDQPTCSDGVQNHDETGIDCGGAVCGACSVSSASATSSDGLVTLTWSETATETRVVRKQGGYPTGPEDGTVVGTFPAGTTTVDEALPPWATWYYALFPWDGAAFGPGTAVGDDGTFVHGTRSCPADQALVGVTAAGDDVLCGSLTVQPTLDCVTVESATGHSNDPVTAHCAAGDSVTGGGFKLIDQDDLGTSADDFTSEPNGEGWFVRFDDEFGGFWSQARCCHVDHALAVTASSSSCAANQVVVGLVGDTGPDDGLTCGDPLQAVQDLDCANQTSGPIPDGGQGTATCTSRPVTGGGFVDVDQEGGGSSADNWDQYPVSGGWYQTYSDDTDSFDTVARCCEARAATLSASGCPVGEIAVGMTSTEAEGFTLDCAAPSAPVALSCEVTSGLDGDKDNPATAYCPAGTEVTGGGFGRIDQDGSGSDDGTSGTDNFSSRPRGDESGWYVQFEDEVGNLDAYAVCCETPDVAVSIP